ncbi:signal peptidase I [Chloroflexota bacterium]
MCPVSPAERPPSPIDASQSERPATPQKQHHRRGWAQGLLRGFLRLPGVYQAASLLSATRFVVEGDSMQPDLASWQHLLVSRLVYRLFLPSRGDLIVLRDPGQPGVHCVKRIIGLPGEHIRMEKGHVFIDGCPLEEPHIEGEDQSDTPFPNQWLLAHDQYFVLGDYREDSRDSRSFGPIRRGHIIGKAWIRYWPPATWKKLG